VELYPAIDIRGGKCVRLAQGDYGRETVYGDDPVGVAASFAASGARWIHVVDLDAARSGVATNHEVIGRVCAAVSSSVEVGGGVRDDVAADRLFDLGVTRVVVGTAAVESPAFVADLARAHPGGVAVGLDARGREVAVRGWVEGSGRDLIELARSFEDVGVAALIVTEIGRDGMLTGPDLEQLGTVLEASAIPLIASGGVGTLADLDALAGLRRAGRTLHGAIAGKAIYEERFTVAEALARLAG
jgi:phosphoribosylformimino-5-aminoimidazole carboxamide ribotide isomerase